MIVTGGGRGIGAATARLAAARGYAICVNYLRNSDAAKTIEREITDAGGRAIAGAADVSKEADGIRPFETARDKLGAPTALVKNPRLLQRPGRPPEMEAARLQRRFAPHITRALPRPP